MKRDHIAVVKTAVGVATIIEVRDRPNSVVIGDSSLFKVEYLDRAITIKPVRVGVKSNLYVFTSYRRYNVQLISGPEASADYVVYLDDPKIKPKGKEFIKWTAFKKSVHVDGLFLNTNRIGRAPNGLLMIDFAVSSTNPQKIKPEWIWLTQGKKTKPIQGLNLTGVEASGKKSVQGLLSILPSDLDLSSAFNLELRRGKTGSIRIPKPSGWK